MRTHHATVEALNTRVFVISFGTSFLAQAWQQDINVSFPLLLDPERAAYRAFGLEYSFRRSWGWRTWLRYARLMLGGYRWRGIQGDSGQLGGDFIVDAGGIVRLAYRSHDPTDRPSVEQLLAVLKRI